MTSKQPVSPRGPKEGPASMRHVAELALDVGLARELDASERIVSSEDMLEGARAFFEKRAPRFTGR